MPRRTQKLVILGLQTTKFCCLISNHPNSALGLLYMYMTMHFRLGHGTAAN